MAFLGDGRNCYNFVIVFIFFFLLICCNHQMLHFVKEHLFQLLQNSFNEKYLNSLKDYEKYKVDFFPPLILQACKKIIVLGFKDIVSVSVKLLFYFFFFYIVFVIQTSTIFLYFVIYNSKLVYASIIFNGGGIQVEGCCP